VIIFQKMIVLRTAQEILEEILKMMSVVSVVVIVQHVKTVLVFLTVTQL
jgi:hypothetical protein